VSDAKAWREDEPMGKTEVARKTEPERIYAAKQRQILAAGARESIQATQDNTQG
jgi:hypothetical protein